MKVQVQDDALRVRVDEAELAALLAGGSLRVAAGFDGRSVFRLEVRLAPHLALAPDADGWRLELPALRLRTYAGTLPRRDALAMAMAGEGDPLRIQFEVDVRDSRKQRGRAASPGRSHVP